jgi:glucan-binding YG repeat protein
MTRKPDALDLEYIQELAKSSQKVQDLIKEKQYTIDEIAKNQIVTQKKIEPSPYPKGDIHHIKRETKTLKTNKEIERETVEVRDAYNDKIKQALEEKALEQDKDYIYPIISEMNRQDTALLLEQGRQAYEAREIETSLALDLDSMDDKSQSLYLDFKVNEKDIDKSPSPSDSFE